LSLAAPVLMSHGGKALEHTYHNSKPHLTESFLSDETKNEEGDC